MADKPNRLLNKALSKLFSTLSEYLNEEQIAKVHFAVEMGCEAHAGQTRKSGEPYVTHPIAVAHILGQMHLDTNALVAAILHDTLEDTELRRAEIESTFGTVVAQLVEGVTKLDKMHFASRADATAESFRKMMMAMSQDIRVIMIKLADRLHNMRTIGAMGSKSRRRIARETLEIYAPIAHRLGMYGVRAELNDLGFRGLYPLRHAVIKDRLVKSRGNNKTSRKKIGNALRQRLKSAQIKGKVKGRLKTPYSIFRKMRSRGTKFESILDVIGFRVVVNNVEDCYRTLGVAHNLYKPRPGRFKDYIAIPKVNGYQSLHTVLIGPYGAPLEVQIRTDDMDLVAEKGIAAHWVYRSEGTVSGAQARAHDWLARLLELQRHAGNSEEFLENIKVDLFPDAVYVFTPNGEIVRLPKDATALDFAYDVHTGVGDSAIKAWIDGELVPLRTTVKSGETIRIVTAESSNPRPEWLDYVTTTKARTAIRHYLKNLQHEDSIELGHRMLDRALDRLGFSLDAMPGIRLERFVKKCGFSRLEELLSEIAMGNRMPSAVARQLAKGLGTKFPGSVEALTITGSEGGVVAYGRCCHPLPDDPIMGHLSAGKGIVIHTLNCPNLGEFRKSPDRWIDCRWGSSTDGEFLVDLRVEVTNNPGALATAAAAISRANCNIEHVDYIDRDGIIATMRFTIVVKDRTHLARAIRRLRRTPVITRVARS